MTPVEEASFEDEESERLPIDWGIIHFEHQNKQYQATIYYSILPIDQYAKEKTH